jgi:hypothetical protein
MAISVLMLVSGCSGLLSFLGFVEEVDSASEPGGSVGVTPAPESLTGVRVGVAHVAPWLAELLAPPSRRQEYTDAGLLSSQALVSADIVEVIVYDAGGTEILRETRTLDLANPTASLDVVVPSGDGYTVEVNVYNTDVSDTEPVVSGTATGVSVTEGGLSQVSITCTPSSPVSLDEGVPESLTVTPWVLSQDAGLVSVGGELWFELAAPAGGNVLFDPALPAGYSYAASVFDSTGALLPEHNLYGSLPRDSGLRVFGLTPSETYYIALIPIGATTDPITVQAQWAELVPTVLTDLHVPDPELRRYFEDETGKQFTTAADPSPPDPITDLDLLSLAELRFNGYAVTDITGLSYCDGAGDLYLSGLDLSGTDQSAGGPLAAELTGMDALVWLDLTSCGLSSLDFLAGLADLEGLYVRMNPELDLADLQILTPTSYPALQYLYLTGWDVNDDGVWDNADVFAGSDWQGVLDLLRPFRYLQSLELSMFYTGDSSFAMLFDTGEVLDTNASTLGSLFLRANELTDASLPLIAALEQLGHVVLGWNPSITDIAALAPLTGLEFLSLYGTGITDLAPLVDLFDGGAFHNHFDYSDIDIDLRDCTNLKISIQSGNQSAIAYLEAGGVRLAYDETFELAGTWYWWDEAEAAYGTTEYDETQATYVWEDGSPISTDALEEYDNAANSALFSTTGPGDAQYLRVEWTLVSEDELAMEWTELQPDVESARSASLLEEVRIYWGRPEAVQPQIDLIGDAFVAVSPGGTFLDSGATVYDWGAAPVTTPAADSGGLDTSVPGTYTLTYAYTDGDGNDAEPVTRTVYVGNLEIQGTWYFLFDGGDSFDFARSVHTNDSITQHFDDDSFIQQLPIVEFDNDGNMLVCVDSRAGDDEYLKVSWTDVAAGVSVLSIYESALDVESARDSTAVSDTISLYADLASVPPVLVLTGDDPLAVPTGEAFVDPGAIAMDYAEPDTTVYASDLGGLDTSVQGTYTVTYTYIDTDGNAAIPITRNVEVGGGVIDLTIQ